MNCFLRKGVPFEDSVLGYVASPTGNGILTFRSNIVSSFGRVRTFGLLNLSTLCYLETPKPYATVCSAISQKIGFPNYTAAKTSDLAMSL
jgi:hypothetical protein